MLDHDKCLTLCLEFLNYWDPDETEAREKVDQWYFDEIPKADARIGIYNLFQCQMIPVLSTVRFGPNHHLWMEKIKNLGIGQSILSAYSQHTLDEMSAHFGLTKYFSHIVGLDNIYAASKLHLGQQLIKKLGNGKGETLMIGDTEHDFEVAAEMGADCVLLSGGHYDKKRLEKLGVTVLDSIRGLL